MSSIKIKEDRLLKSEILKKHSYLNDKDRKEKLSPSKLPFEYISVDEPFFPVIKKSKKQDNFPQTVHRKQKRLNALVDIDVLIK